MPRYYFHVRNRVGLIRDREGKHLGGPKAALEHATREVTDMALKRSKNGETADDVEIQVYDETGLMLFTVPVSADR